MDKELKTKFIDYKKKIKNAFVRPAGIPDDWRWTTTIHILKVYYQKCVTMKQMTMSESITTKEEMKDLISMLTDEIHPNDKLLIHFYITDALYDWFETAIEDELYEIGVNLKNVAELDESTG